MKLFLCVLSVVSPLVFAEFSVEYRLPAARVQIEFGELENAEIVNRSINVPKGAYWPVPADRFIQVKYPVRVTLLGSEGDSETIISRHLAGEAKLPYSTYETQVKQHEKEEFSAHKALKEKMGAWRQALADPRAKVSVVVTESSVAISEIKLPK